MKEEYGKSTPSEAVMLDRMMRTYQYRRKEVKKGEILVEELIKKYPAFHLSTIVS